MNAPAVVAALVRDLKVETPGAPAAEIVTELSSRLEIALPGVTLNHDALRAHAESIHRANRPLAAQTEVDVSPMAARGTWVGVSRSPLEGRLGLLSVTLHLADFLLEDLAGPAVVVGAEHCLGTLALLGRGPGPGPGTVPPASEQRVSVCAWWSHLIRVCATLRLVAGELRPAL